MNKARYGSVNERTVDEFPCQRGDAEETRPLGYEALALQGLNRTALATTCGHRPGSYRTGLRQGFRQLLCRCSKHLEG